MLIRAVFLCEFTLSSKSLTTELDEVEMMEYDGKKECEDILTSFRLAHLKQFYHRIKKEHADLLETDEDLFEFDPKLQKYAKVRMKERLDAVNGVIK